MNYTLRQLNIFLKVAEYQSITLAAEELYLTQPAVSIQLKKLQENFSIPLTEVVGRRLYITDFGKEIAKAAEKIFNEVEAINYKTMAFQDQLSGRLRISVASTGKYVMPYFLADFMSMHRGVDLIMDVTNKRFVIESLERNEVDFSLVSVPPEKLETHKIDLLDNKLFLIGATKLNKNRKGSVRQIFEKERMLYREPGSATRHAMESFIKSKNMPIYKMMELTSNEALKQAVIAGLGYTIMPLIGLKNALLDKELEIIPCRGLPIKTKWHLVWLKAKNLSPVANAFIEYLEKEKERIKNQYFLWHDGF